MKQYLINLIPRLIEYSSSLEKIEIFVDAPWVNINNNLVLQKYIFKRDGDLIISLNGKVTIGSWNYLSSAKSILIDSNQNSLLLNQNFIDSAVMILNRDGFKNDYLVLVNENLLPDLNFEDYIKRLYYKKHNIFVMQLKNGDSLELIDYKGNLTENKVTIEGKSVPDGILELVDSGNKLIIKDSKVYKVLVEIPFKTDKGIIRIEKVEYNSPSIGNIVFKNNDLAPDGKYRLGFMNYISVKNGEIIKTKSISRKFNDFILYKVLNGKIIN